MPDPTPAAPAPEAAPPAATTPPLTPTTEAAPASPPPTPTEPAAPAPAEAAPASFASQSEAEKPPAEAGKEPAEGDKPAAEPESVTALTADDMKIELPEGMTLQDEAMTNFLTAANSAKLSKEDAQSLLKMHVGQVQTMADDWVAAQTKTWNDTNEAWRGEILADPVLGKGNEGKTLAVLASAIDGYGDKDLRAALDMTGAGNHPSIVRFIHKMASALTEGGIKPGGLAAPKGGPKGGTLGERLYGS